MAGKKGTKVVQQMHEETGDVHRLQQKTVCRKSMIEREACVFPKLLQRSAKKYRPRPVTSIKNPQQPHTARS